MNRSKYISLVLAAALCMTACTDRKKQPAQGLIINDSTLQAEGITFDTLSLNIKKNLIEGHDAPSYDIQMVMLPGRRICRATAGDAVVCRLACQSVYTGVD